MGVYIWNDNYSAMQGPCPDGFHIPLSSERNDVYTIWTALGGGSADGTNFGIALKMPFAGYRDLSSSNVSGQGIYGDYWSSSPYDNTDVAYILTFNSSVIYPQQRSGRASGYSVRCFKDSPTVPTSSWAKLYGTSIEAGGIFWSSADGLISLSSDGQTWITIQDKNLGATQVWNNGDTLSEANCGKYYQWGNNYGFAWTGSVTTYSTQVDASNYGPGNYYSSSTFITGNNDWSSVQNDNLRGGVTGVNHMSELKNAYIGEYGWTPGANTMLYYKFDGNLNDSSGNNRNATASGTVSYGLNYVDLNGGYLTIPSLTYSSPTTIVVWYKSFSGGGYIFDIVAGGVIARYVDYGVQNGYTGWSDYPSYSPFSGSSTDDRHLFIRVFGTAETKLYRDNIEIATKGAWNGTYSADRGNKIGASWDGTGINPHLYVGKFIIENKARTTQEISDYYNQTKGNYGL